MPHNLRHFFLKYYIKSLSYFQKDKIQFYVLLILIFWISLPNGSNYKWGYAIVEIISFLLLLNWIWIHSDKYNFKQLKPYRTLLICIGLFQIWTFIQQIIIPLNWLNIISPITSDNFRATGALVGSISVDPNNTFIELFKGCSYLCILFLTLVLTTSEKRLRLLVTVMFIAGLYQALYGQFLVLTKADHLFFENPRWIGIATGGFISRNHYANFLLLTLSIGIGLLVSSLISKKSSNMHSKMRVWLNTLFSEKALLRTGLTFMVIALVMSRSRMGNTAFFISMTFTGIFAMAFLKNKTRSLMWLFGSMLIIDILIVSSWFGLEKVQQRLETTSAEQESRDEVVKYGIELVKQQPLVGYGGGSFNTSFQTVQGPGINLYYYYAHNEYLQFSAEYGLPATLMLGYLVLLSLWHAQYALRNRRSNLMRGMAFASMRPSLVI